MELIIPLPNSCSANTYAELKAYLKQLELSVHYAQKSVESAEQNGVPVTEDLIVTWQHPSLIEELVDNNYEELQSIELKIILQ